MGLLSSMTIKYEVDLTNLTSGISRVKQELASVVPAAQSSSGGLLSGFKNAAGGLLDFGAKVGQTIFGIQNLASGAVGLAQSLLAPAAAAEQVQGSLEVFTGSATKAKQVMADLSQFASHTPFETGAIDQAALKLMSVGVNAKDVVPDLLALGDSLDAVGRTSSADLSMIADTFLKIKTSGHLTSEAMGSFAAQGIDAWSVLQKQTGKTHEQLQAMISGGLYPAKQAMHDLTVGIEANPLYKGQMANDANVFNGALSTLKSNWDQMLAAFGSPVIKALEPIMANIASTLASPAFKDFASGVGDGIVKVFAGIGRAASSLAPLFKNIDLNSLKEGLLNVDPLIGSIASHAGDLGKWFQTSVIPAVKDATPGFKNLGDALVKLLPAFQQTSGVANGAFKQAFDAFLPIFERAVPLVIRFAGVLADGLGTAIKFLTPYFVQASNAVNKFAGEIATRVAPIISQWLDRMQQGLQAFSQVWAVIWPALKPVLQGTWDQIVGIVKIAWALLSGVIKIGLDLLSGNWKQAWEDFKTMLAGVWDGIVTYLKGALLSMIGSFRPFLDMLANIPGPVGDMAKKVLAGMNGMSLGTISAVDQMKISTLNNTAQMHTQMAAKFELMRQDLIAKIKATSDPVQKHALEMKLGVITHTEQMHKQAAANAQNMANAVVAHSKNMSDQMVGHSIIPDMVNSVISWFAQLPGRAGAEISKMTGSVLGQLQNIATGAYNSGASIVSQVVAGIQSKIGEVGAVMNNLAATISDYLPRSPAKRGPLMDIHRRMPTMVNMLQEGIESGVPRIESSIRHLVTPLSNTLRSPQTSFSVSGTGPQFVSSIARAAQPLKTFAPSSSGATAFVAAASSGGSSSSSTPREQHLYFEVDGVQLAHIVNTNTDRIVRLKLGPRGRSA